MQAGVANPYTFRFCNDGPQPWLIQWRCVFLLSRSFPVDRGSHTWEGLVTLRPNDHAWKAEMRCITVHESAAPIPDRGSLIGVVCMVLRNPVHTCRSL